MTFEVNLEQFKQATAEFLKALPTASLESLDNGWKALGLMYLGMKEEAASDRPIAVSYLEYAGRKYNERSFQLELAT